MTNGTKKFDNKLAFALAWWDLWNPGEKYRGVCINGCSNSEFIAVASWVAFNDLPRKPEITMWYSDIDPLFEEQLGIKDIFHVEFNEIAIYAPDDVLDDLREFLDTLSFRQYELVVAGLDRGEIERICSGSNYRLLKNKAVIDQYAISTDNKDAYAELTLRADIRYNDV